MNDSEIKEILDKLEIVARKHTIEVCEDGSKIETMPASVVDELRLNNFSAKILYDYITNLQDTLKDREENIFALETTLTNLQQNYDRIYNENCKLREKHNINDISLLDENYELQQELKYQKEAEIEYNEKHTKLMNMYKDYKSRNEKAIEYIDNIGFIDWEDKLQDICLSGKKMKSILQDGDKE